MASILRLPTMVTSAQTAASSFARSTSATFHSNGLLRASTQFNLLTSQPQQQQHRHVTGAAKSKKTKKKRGYNKGVRVILTSDIPDKNGGMYTHEVHKVKPGFARNYLIPEKLALYATPANFNKLGLLTEEEEAGEAKEVKVGVDDEEEGSEEMKAADFLAHYLRNKVLKIKRNVDPSTNAVFPGLVNAQNLRDKLSKQLKIDLDDDEQIHIHPTPVMHAELSEDDVEKIMKDLGDNKVEQGECDVKLKVLGEFVARITLAANHAVPLKFVISKR